MKLYLVAFLLYIINKLVTKNFPSLGTRALVSTNLLCLTNNVLVPVTVLPVIFLSALSGKCVLPVNTALLCLVPMIVTPTCLAKVRPLTDIVKVCPRVSRTTTTVMRDLVRNILFGASPLIYINSLLLVNTAFTTTSMITLGGRSC